MKFMVIKTACCKTPKGLPFEAKRAIEIKGSYEFVLRYALKALHNFMVLGV
jgi:hypothetical protein